MKVPMLLRRLSTEAPRVNPVGIQYLSKCIDQKVFPGKYISSSEKGQSIEEPSHHKSQLIELSKKYLASHELLGKTTNIQAPISLNIPDLTASNIDDHFRRIGEFSLDPYRNYALDLSVAKLPPKPEKFELRSGWLKYAKGKKRPKAVPYPDEDAIVFDVETLYKVSNYPVMAVACSKDAWYAWCSPILTGESTSFEHLVPLNTLRKEQVVVGHNVGYDRARVKEEYSIEETKAFYLDTMSLHIAVSGMCSQQRIKWMVRRKAQKAKELGDLAEEESDSAEGVTNDEVDMDKLIRQLEVDDPWLNHSSPNSLADLACFYFGEKVDKDLRDSFSGTDIEIIKEDFQSLIQYCANDVAVTHKVYAHVLPAFLRVCPHPVSFAALRFMSAGILPTDEKWPEYLNNAESLYLKNRQRVDDRLIELAESAVALRDTPEAFESDPWLSQLDWTITPPKIKKNGEPYKNQRLPGYPAWYRDIYSTKDEKLQMTTRTRLTPLLLKLKFESYPVIWNSQYGWCFKAVSSDYQRLRSLSYELINEMTFGEDEKDHKIDEDRLPEFIYFKIPNRSSPEIKTTQLLTKSYMPAFESGLLKSDEPFAQEALALNASCSYWVSARDRIKSQFVVPYNNDDSLSSSSPSNQVSLIVPQVITMGTVTRRAVEKTWLTASNAKRNRIGSELKSKIRAPDNYCFVGADVDSEELWIASLLGDSILEQHGGTAIGWMTLEGSKKEGTDLHSKTAKILGISRDQAKIFNYGRIYGAGVKFAASLLKSFNSELTEKECLQRAKVLYSETKGQTVVVSIAGERRKLWFGGSESVLFNELERIASLEQPRTPVLKAGITQALMKKNLNLNSFLPSRVNWAIQSSGVDYLHLLCVSMNYLIKRYGLNARLSISVHDEIRYLVEKKDKYRVAMALQISNVWTRAMFAESVGMSELPQSCAFFSAVDVDHIFRKEVDMDCVTPSNPIAETPGESLDISALLEKGDKASLGKGETIELPELKAVKEDQAVEEVNKVDPEYQYSYSNPEWKRTSVKMQISQKKEELQSLLRRYKKNYGISGGKSILAGDSIDEGKKKTKGGIKSSVKVSSVSKEIGDKSKKPSKKATPISANTKSSDSNTTYKKKSTKANHSSVKTIRNTTPEKRPRIDPFETQYPHEIDFELDLIKDLSIDAIANMREIPDFFYNTKKSDFPPFDASQPKIDK